MKMAIYAANNLKVCRQKVTIKVVTMWTWSQSCLKIVPKLSQNGPKVFQDCPKVVPKLPLMSQQEHIVLERSARLTPDPKIYRRNVLKAKMMFVGGNKKSAENRRSPDNRLQ